MENFRRNNRFSGRSGGGGFGSRNSGKTKMYKAVCSKCGKECEVPFEPRGDKPVFCSDCFRSEGNVEPKRFGGRDSRRPSFSNKKMYEAICDKCGKKCEVPFKPTGDRPVYCSECFSKENNNKSSGQVGSNKQLDIINTKLDEILKLLNPVVLPKTTQKKEAIKKEKIIKPKETKKVKIKKAIFVKKTKAKKKK